MFSYHPPIELRTGSELNSGSSSFHLKNRICHSRVGGNLDENTALDPQVKPEDDNLEGI